jgi:hypothetical protein
MKKVLCYAWMAGLALVCLSALSIRLSAQATQPKSRIIEPIDETNLRTLSGSTHPLARAEFDQGPVSPDLRAQRMLLVLSRSPEQETALQQLLAEQQDKTSSSFHQWLSPEQFGQQFGPSDEDVQTITSWLSSHGFQVSSVSAGRSSIEFSGTADQVQKAFHTSIHNLNVNGEAHIANMSDVQIPAALTPVVKTVLGLHNFLPKPASQYVGAFTRSKETGETRPALTGTSGPNTIYALGPADFATIYNVFHLWRGDLAPLTPATAIDGTGQTIAIVGTSNINLQDVLSFRTFFGLPTNLPANTPKVILNGPDPGNLGSNSSEGEADLDVEWSGAVAKGAQIVLVVSENPLTFGAAGNDLSALYIVDNNVAPVMSVSFLACEAQFPTVSSFYTALWGQAAAQGITAMVASGDAGSAGCDNFNTASDAVDGLSVNAIASTAYNVAVGGTDFDDVGVETNFFLNNNITTSDGYTNLSARGYIPEIPWNNSCAANGIANCSTSTPASLLNILAGSGGPSALINKPSWQNGFGSAEIQSDGKRDIPDVSLFASNGGSRAAPSFYAFCEADSVSNPAFSCNSNVGNPTFAGSGGTSISSPAFAGMIAMVNQATGSRQGNANFVLYPLSTIGNKTCNTATPTIPCIFYDVTKNNNAVPCAGGKSGCSSGTLGTIGVMVDPNNSATPAWNAGTGYDRATGLGTVNAFNLVTSWTSVPALTGASASLTIQGQSVAVPAFAHGTSVSVAVHVTSGGGTPTGTISLIGGTGSPQLGIIEGTLSGGSVTFNTALLPGGTYTAFAQYGGDGKFAPATSNSVSLTITKENSLAAATLYGCNPNSFPEVPCLSNTVTYGSPYIMRVDVTNSGGQQCTVNAAVACPTGTVTLKDNLNPLNDFDGVNTSTLVNGVGFLEDQPIQLPAGNHSIVASYQGDASYNASPPSSPLAVTVTKANTATSVTGFPITVAAGTLTTLMATVNTASSGVSPSGSVSFFEGSTLLGSANLVAGAPVNGAAVATASLSTSLSGLYFVPNNRPRIRRFILGPGFYVAALFTAIAFMLSRFIPRKRRSLIFLGLILFVVGLATVGCGGSSGGGGGGGGGGGSKVVTLTATYNGDTNYTGSNSTGVSVTVN